jgi:hypothetical protein
MITLKKKEVKEVKEVKIDTVLIGTINLWKDNPRKNNAAVPKLAEILKVHGQVTPIVVWRENMVAYKGNTTLKAMKLLGERAVKVLFVDFPSEQAAIAYGIADNKTSEWSQWDDELLNRFMQMETVSALSGFDAVEQDYIIKRLAANNEKELNDELTTKHKCPSCGFRY